MILIRVVNATNQTNQIDETDQMNQKDQIDQKDRKDEKARQNNLIILWTSPNFFYEGDEALVAKPQTEKRQTIPINQIRQKRKDREFKEWKCQK